MRIVFISDQFLSDSTGGAELCLQAHIDTCRYQYITVKSKDLDLARLDKKHDLLVINNFFEITPHQIQQIINDFKYVIIECDYKYCFFRSKHKHKAFRGVECQCEKTPRGILVGEFFLHAKYIFWKSEGQRDEYFLRYPALKDKQQVVLSSVFSDATLDLMISLRDVKKGPQYFVLKSDSWIKGFEESVKYCKEHGFRYVVGYKLSYERMLRMMARCKGIVYMPRGFDVSCRMITEAKIMGLEIHTNQLVQHVVEDWFKGSINDIIAFQRGRNEVFWSTIGGIIDNE